MWNRIQYDTWTDIVPIVAFVCTFSVFLVLSIRALLMKKKDAKRMAHLPLEEQPGDAPDAEDSDMRPSDL